MADLLISSEHQLLFETDVEVTCYNFQSIPSNHGEHGAIVLVNYQKI